MRREHKLNSRNVHRDARLGFLRPPVPIGCGIEFRAPNTPFAEPTQPSVSTRDVMV